MRIIGEARTEEEGKLLMQIGLDEEGCVFLIKTKGDSTTYCLYLKQVEAFLEAQEK